MTVKDMGLGRWISFPPPPSSGVRQRAKALNVDPALVLVARGVFPGRHEAQARHSEALLSRCTCRATPEAWQEPMRHKETLCRARTQRRFPRLSFNLRAGEAVAKVRIRPAREEGPQSSVYN